MYQNPNPYQNLNLNLLETEFLGVSEIASESQLHYESETQSKIVAEIESETEFEYILYTNLKVNPESNQKRNRI